MDNQNLISLLNALNIEQRSLDLRDDLPEEYLSYFSRCVASGVAPCVSHRDYKVATKVYAVQDGFVGVSGISAMSGKKSFADIGCILIFFPMSEISFGDYIQI